MLSSTVGKSSVADYVTKFKVIDISKYFPRAIKTQTRDCICFWITDFLQ